MKRRDYLNLAAYTATLCFGLSVLYLFAQLWTHGTLFLYEDNLIIRGIETAMGLGLSLLGLWGVLTLIRKAHRKRV